MSILNIISQVLAYNDVVGDTDNPNQRAFDWTRKFNSLSLSRPKSDQVTLAPGESFEIFDGTRANPLDLTSVLSIALISAVNSLYRLSVTAGTSGFRAIRAVSGVDAVTVSVNNNAVAVFTFTAATLTGVTVGDTMRIKGAAMFDSAPFVFNPLNSGIWTIIGISGNVVSAVRPVGLSFSGANETVGGAAADVQFYSSAGIQVGDKVLIGGTFSPVSWRAYTVASVTPSAIDFVSAVALPDEAGLSYASGSLVFYTNLKKFIYLEADQDAVVRFNGDITDNNRITPISAGDPTLPGFLHKIGDTYSCTVVNKSVNSLNLLFFVGE